MNKIFIAIVFLLPLMAQALPTEPVSPIGTTGMGPDAGLIARIDLEQTDEVIEALMRVEAYHQQVGFNVDHPPVAFVIFGPPVALFFKDSYRENRQIIDLAARLVALEVIDVKVCEFSYQAEGLDSNNLLPFVSTVPFGPDEVTRLVQTEKYNYF
jgi:intracellular sulfur oxidation DsrE/DsrF family protein